MDTKIELGKKYVDTLHGLEGVATALCKYLTGCDYVCLEYVKEMEVKELWLDVVRVAACKEEPVTDERNDDDFGMPGRATRGGPHGRPGGHSMPSR